jgi:hypothetical protein
MEKMDRFKDNHKESNAFGFVKDASLSDKKGSCVNG